MIDDNIFVHRIVVGAFSANCYIVGSRTGKGLIIDPGGDAKLITRAIDDARLEIATIVLTHGHSDHMAALYEIQHYTGATLEIHQADSQVLRGAGEYSSMFGIAYRTAAPPDRLLVDKDVIEVGDLRFRVVHTPGHTPGSICLYIDKGIFSGDTLFYHGIGTTYTLGSSRLQLIDSINRRLMTLPDETIVYPGHGPQTTIGGERQHNRYV
jgi:hydroxyacylglutathione hydrolase